MNNAALNAPVEVFVWTYVFIFLGIIPGNGIAESYGNLAFWETTQYVIEVGSPCGTLTYVSLLCLWLSLFLISSQFSVAFSFLLVFDFQKFDYDVSRSEYSKKFNPRHIIHPRDLGVPPPWFSLPFLHLSIQDVIFFS